jgi:hypothetical protein
MCAKLLQDWFGFKQETGCADALTVIVYTLINADSSGRRLALARLNLGYTFNTLIYAVMVLKAGEYGLNLALIYSHWNLYSRL